jgi:hypothetical protein
MGYISCDMRVKAPSFKKPNRRNLMGCVLMLAGLALALYNMMGIFNGRPHPGIVLLLSILSIILIFVGYPIRKRDERRARDKQIGW